MVDIDEEEGYLFEKPTDPQNLRYLTLVAKIRHVFKVYQNMGLLLKITLISSIVDVGALPINIIRGVWQILNRINNPLKFLVAYVLSTLLPRVFARAYTPFAAVPIWTAWNYRKAKLISNEGLR